MKRFFIGLLLVGAATAQARLVEEQLDLPVQVRDAYGRSVDRAIRVTVFVDDTTPAPHPIVIINHGRAVEPTERAALGRARYTDISRWFAREGFLVAVPTRIGYGVTGGDDLEDSGACARKNYPPGYLAAAHQTVAVLDAMAARADTLKDRSVVLGQSYGGAVSVAVASLNPSGVVAAINFAGGGGGNPKTQPQAPCAPQSLERMFSDFGSRAHVPMLWAYTENDQYFGASYPKAWVKAFRDSGATAEFIQFEPHGEDGHSLFTRFPAVWRPAAAAFLRKQGFTIRETP